jgi:RNA polymerase sigma-70 factor, ECF subfamily
MIIKPRASVDSEGVRGSTSDVDRAAGTASERRDSVPTDSERGSRSLEDYRDYLRLLARFHIPTGLKGQFDASDAAQQALLKAHENHDQFRGHTDLELKAWLRAILARILADASRINRRRRGDAVRSIEAALEQSSTRLEAFLVSEQSNPSEKAMRAEQTLRLASVLQRLPNDQRTALELRYLKGLPVAAVAEEMGRGPESVTGLLYRGMQTLRRLMDGTP